MNRELVGGPFDGVCVDCEYEEYVVPFPCGNRWWRNYTYRARSYDPAKMDIVRGDERPVAAGVERKT
jgi:hypothetical protein